MTNGPEHNRQRPDLPDGVQPLGVPDDTGVRNAFVWVTAAVVALLALIFTLGWIVFHQLS